MCAIWYTLGRIAYWKCADCAPYVIPKEGLYSGNVLIVRHLTYPRKDCIVEMCWLCTIWHTPGRIAWCDCADLCHISCPKRKCFFGGAVCIHYLLLVCTIINRVSFLCWDFAVGANYIWKVHSSKYQWCHVVNFTTWQWDHIVNTIWRTVVRFCNLSTSTRQSSDWTALWNREIWMIVSLNARKKCLICKTKSFEFWDCVDCITRYKSQKIVNVHCGIVESM